MGLKSYNVEIEEDKYGDLEQDHKEMMNEVNRE